MRAVLRAASTKDNPVLHGGDIELIFDDFLGKPSDYRGLG
jgi:hypothetical protein